jgi:hypothetical protein
VVVVNEDVDGFDRMRTPSLDEATEWLNTSHSGLPSSADEHLVETAPH